MPVGSSTALGRCEGQRGAVWQLVTDPLSWFDVANRAQSAT